MNELSLPPEQRSKKPNNDILFGGQGNDILDGGSGIDTVSYASFSNAVTASLAIAASQNTIGAGNDKLSEIENLEGTYYDDTLTVILEC